MMFADIHNSSGVKKHLRLCFLLDFVSVTCTGNEMQPAARELLRALKFYLILSYVRICVA